MDATAFLRIAAVCAPLVAPGTALALAQVESSLNPFAIGVVGGKLLRQPRTLAQALRTARQLASDGWSYSVGLAQINQANFGRLGLSVESAFDPCVNLRAMQSVLADCYSRGSDERQPQQRLRDALSCYYSGNFSTGYRHGYVKRVASAAQPPP
jgi:type IV secretion system protein VirB1